jgi:CubicO group peptidase (beta-lactamase class C family)
LVLKVDVPASLVHGEVDEGFGPVADAFRRNFAAGLEVGAACAVYRQGRPVVDLWGGYRDGIRRLPWRRDTMVSLFSATKGVAAVAMAVGHSRGLFELDVPVARYWPGFGVAGKEGITVRQLLAHQAGLPYLDRKLDLDTVADHARLGRLLEQQRPVWEPGTRHGYHAVTLGWYESQLLARTDAQGRTIGRYLADEVTGPLGVAFHIGLPDEVADERLATIHSFKPPEMLLHLGDMPSSVLIGMLNPRGSLSRAMRMLPALMDPAAWNRRSTLRIEVPSVNGTGEVRGLAAIYGELAVGGERVGITAATMAELTRPAVAPSGGARDVALRVDNAYAMGFLKPSTTLPFGRSPAAFGTPGGGGSLGFADPQTEIGYAYGMNRLGFHFPVDPREGAIRRALYRVLDGPLP